MKILLTTNQLTMGGAERMVVRLAGELAARHTVVVASDGGPLAAELPPAVPHLHAPARGKGPLALWRFAERLRAIMSDHGIDLVHAHSPNTAIAARLARGGRPIPVVVSAHGSWLEWKKPFVARGFALGGDVVVGCSTRLTADLIAHGLPARLATTIHNGIPFEPGVRPTRADRAAVRAELGLAETAPLILGVGRLDEKKGFGDLLTALVDIRARVPEAHVAIAGEGEFRPALEAQIARLGLAGCVHLLGNRGDVSRLLGSADLFCLPSLTEGLPLSVAEAMAMRLPVVATPVGGVSELVEEGRTGLLVPTRDPSRLAEAIVGLLRDGEARRAFGEAGCERVAAHFTLRLMAERFEALYDAELSRAHRVRIVPKEAHS